MQKITVNKEELKARLIENKAKHIAEYNEQVEGYRTEALEWLASKHMEMKENETDPTEIGLHFTDPVPRSFEKEYDTMIEMLKLSIDENVELSHGEFRQYVMDDWIWKGEFTSNTMMYAKVRHKRG
jgi:hypothetical protein